MSSFHLEDTPLPSTGTSGRKYGQSAAFMTPAGTPKFQEASRTDRPTSSQQTERKGVSSYFSSRPESEGLEPGEDKFALNGELEDRTLHLETCLAAFEKLDISDMRFMLASLKARMASKDQSPSAKPIVEHQVFEEKPPRVVVPSNLPQYKRGADVDNFFDLFLVQLEGYNLPVEKTWRRLLPMCLTGTALTWLKRFLSECPDLPSFIELRLAFTQAFKPRQVGLPFTLA
jgi:hypothetical protein